MFVDFFYQLRQARIPVTIREYLMLLEAMEKGAAGISVDQFYVLARAAMVKDEVQARVPYPKVAKGWTYKVVLKHTYVQSAVRGSDFVQEITGEVRDATGKKVWESSGKWEYNMDTFHEEVARTLVERSATTRPIIYQ